MIGGAVGYITWKWYFLDELWIEEVYRKNGIGTKLIDKIEKCAKENNLLGVRMETWSFQQENFMKRWDMRFMQLLKTVHQEQLRKKF